MAKAPAEIRSLARSYTRIALKTLAAIVSSDEAPAAARVSAAQALLDRGWGRPDQHSTVDVVKHGPTDWTRDELVAIIAAASGSGAAEADGSAGTPGSVH